MSDQRAKLVALKPAAQAAKEAFASEYVHHRSDLAVGIGLNRQGDHWAVKVFAQTPAAAESIPDHYGEYDVEVQVAGIAKSF